MYPWRSRAASALLLLSLGGVGCMTAKLDMRNIENPVLLNALPSSGDDRVVRPIDAVDVKVNRSLGIASTGYTSTSSSTVENDAELVAFEKVGGYDDRAITEMEVTAGGSGVNLLLILVGSVTVTGKGQVVVLESAASASAPDPERDRVPGDASGDSGEPSTNPEGEGC